MRGTIVSLLVVLLFSLSGCDLSRDKAASAIDNSLKNTKLFQRFLSSAGGLHEAPGGGEILRLLAQEGYVKQDKKSQTLYECTQKGYDPYCKGDLTLEYASFERVTITKIEKQGDTRVVAYTATYKSSGVLGTMIYKEGKSFTRPGGATFRKFDYGWRL